MLREQYQVKIQKKSAPAGLEPAIYGLEVHRLRPQGLSIRPRGHFTKIASQVYLF